MSSLRICLEIVNLGNLAFKTWHSGDKEITQYVKCLPYKYENLSSILAPNKKPGRTSVCLESQHWGRLEICCWPVSLAESFSSRFSERPSQNIKWRVTEEDTQNQSLASTCTYTHAHANSKYSILGLARCLAKVKLLVSKLEVLSLILRPTWWKERIDSCRLSSDLHTHVTVCTDTDTHTPTCTHTHTYNKCKIIKESVKIFKNYLFFFSVNEFLLAYMCTHHAQAVMDGS